MSATYRLPDSLGGHRCEILVGFGDGEVNVTVDGYPDIAVRLPRARLVEVEPELPPEPPLWSVVLVGQSSDTTGSVWRRFPAGWSNYIVHALGWSEVCAQSDDPPVLLVPDPVAGAETWGEWKCVEAERDRFVVRAGNYGSGSVVEVAVRGGTEMVYLSREDAESAGRTLLAAARQP